MEFKKIKDLSEKDLTEFSTFFSSGCPVSMKVNEVPKLLTLSEELRQNTRSLVATSGAEMGMGLEVYRYDIKDKSKGFPINRDVYKISGSSLLKAQLPFENHWLGSVPI